MVRSNIHTHEVVGCFIFVARLLQNFGRIKKMANLQVQAAKKQEYDRIMSVLAIVQYCERSDDSLSGCNHFIEMSQPVASLSALVLLVANLSKPQLTQARMVIGPSTQRPKIFSV